MKFFGTMKDNNGMLEIGGVLVSSLAKDYKTPLYIVDQTLVEENIQKYLNGFKSSQFKTSVVYAAKAFLSKGICQIVDKYGLEIDAVSGGELHAIKASNFPMERVHMHGNNKTIEELEMCVDYGIGLVIIDNEEESLLLNDIAKAKNKKIKTMLRLNVGIDAHTHEYIKTAKDSSKFGESIYNPNIKNIVKSVESLSNCEFIGFHCHIGSQIFDIKAYSEAIETMIGFTKEINEELNIKIPEINLGGGFGVYYTKDDAPIDLEAISKLVTEKLEETLKVKELSFEKVSIEPGRSIIANAGSTLYTIGGQKKTYGGINYIFVDGGMSDNIRPALYQAEYEAIVANKVGEIPTEEVAVAGKFCESSDILIKNIKLPKTQRGDLLLIPTTGAYGHAMASNYNKAPIPAVVFVKDGKSKVAVKRQSYNDMILNDDFIDL